MNNKNTAAATAEETARRGRPQGWKAALTIPCSLLLAAENKKFLNLLGPVRVTEESKIPRTPEEIMEVFSKATDEEKTNPQFLAAMPFKTVVAETILEMVQENPEGKITVPRKDVVAAYQAMQAAAIQFLCDNDEGEK
jgi:hypothetical protein